MGWGMGLVGISWGWVGVVWIGMWDGVIRVGMLWYGFGG